MSQIIVECPIWKAVLADDRLAAARRKLSFHEIRLIIEHAKANATQRSRAPEVTEAARALVEKLDECAPHIENAGVFMHVHGMSYNGPQYGEALEALRKALAMSAEAPRAVEGEGDG